MLFLFQYKKITYAICDFDKKLSYPRGTARCVVSVEILPIAKQQFRNYLYYKSKQIEVMKLEGYSGLLQWVNV